MKLGASLSRRCDEADGEAGIEGHGDERRLAEARDAFDADAPRVDRPVRLEVIERTTRAPRPRTQRSPVIGLPRLTFVDEADDALRQAGAVVCLDAAWIQKRVSPTRRDQ